MFELTITNPILSSPPLSNLKNKMDEQHDEQQINLWTSNCATQNNGYDY